jgi:hypothetical protein
MTTRQLSGNGTKGSAPFIPEAAIERNPESDPSSSRPVFIITHLNIDLHRISERMSCLIAKLIWLVHRNLLEFVTVLRDLYKSRRSALYNIMNWPVSSPPLLPDILRSALFSNNADIAGTYRLHIQGRRVSGSKQSRPRAEKLEHVV